MKYCQYSMRNSGRSREYDTACNATLFLEIAEFPVSMGRTLTRRRGIHCGENRNKLLSGNDIFYTLQPVND